MVGRSPQGIANQREASRRWNRAHRERGNEANKRWRQKHLELHNEANLKWDHENPEKANVWKRRWADKNPEKIKEISRRYHQTHPEVALESKARRRIRQYSNGFVERIYRNVVWKRDGGICGICKLPVVGRWELDHRIPIARGGSHTYKNVQVAHPGCNRQKGVKMKVEGLQGEALELLFNRPTSNDVEVLEWVRDRVKWLGLDKQRRGQLLGAYLALEKKEAEK